MNNKLNNFGPNVSQGRNEHTFTSENQPKNKGRKKTSEIMKLMKEMGRRMAPAELLKDDNIKDVLVKLGLKGEININNALIARLYAQALFAGDIKAIKLILDTMNNKNGGGKNNKMIIHFISPSIKTTDDNELLISDSWNSVPEKVEQLNPGESGHFDN